MVEKKKKKEREEAGIHVDLGLGGIFKGLSGIIESVSKLGSEFEDIDTTKTGEIKGWVIKSGGIMDLLSGQWEAGRLR